MLEPGSAAGVSLANRNARQQNAILSLLANDRVDGHVRCRAKRHVRAGEGQSAALIALSSAIKESWRKIFIFSKAFFDRSRPYIPAEYCLNCRRCGSNSGTRNFVKMTAGTD
jgi:hypothetical protein